MDRRLAGAPPSWQPVHLLPRPRLAGLFWLVWRRHRAAFRTVLAGTAAILCWILIEEHGMSACLRSAGLPGTRVLDDGFASYGLRLFQTGHYLGYLPVLLGVFVGAPLLAGDLENGTARLVLGHDVSRRRWLATKLGVTCVLLAACSVACSIAFAHWWAPVREEASVMDWTSSAAFDVTGPVPVAMTLLAVVTGAAVGMVLRRTLAAMACTLACVSALIVVWSRFRIDLGSVQTVVSRGDVSGGPPALPGGGHPLGLGPSFTTRSGAVLPWDTCLGTTADGARNLCLAAHHVTGWSIRYLPISEMSRMQWTGAALLLALASAVVGFTFLSCRKYIT
jgi:hypothetical protein